MAGETIITVIGNLTDDPELKFTPSGAAVANFTVASTPRTFDRQTNEWKDGDALFIRCAAWRQLAENVAESLQKGQRVIVTGALQHPQLRAPGRIEGHERRDQRRRDRPFAALRHGQGHQAPTAPAAATSVAARVAAATPATLVAAELRSSNPWSTQPAAQGGSDAWGGNAGTTDEPPF